MFMRGKGTDILSAWVGFFLTVDSCRVTVFFFLFLSGGHAKFTSSIVRGG